MSFLVSSNKNFYPWDNVVPVKLYKLQFYLIVNKSFIFILNAITRVLLSLSIIDLKCNDSILVNEMSWMATTILMTKEWNYM